MVFSSIIFLFFFLPAMFGSYQLVGCLSRGKNTLLVQNILLLIFSLVFYAWGEPVYVFLMLLSITINYLTGRWIGSAHSAVSRRAGLIFGTVFNLGVIGIFKYYNFIAECLNPVLMKIQPGVQIPNTQIPLPVGISFFTFQALSYLVDVYRKTTVAQPNIFNLGLYIALFPQLIAGPIVRYHDIARQLTRRSSHYSQVSYGCRRFIVGLAKKMLIANTMAVVADAAFAQTGIANMTVPLAWVGALAYTAQIYYDFSGYSDMAIGLGNIFGFRFLENFNYPYVAKSIREFWQRWHISLSNWFRDYLYIPLGGNRTGALRTYLNLLIVFFLCGLWHGAAYTFIVWGLYHGFFLVLERAGLGRLLKRAGVLPRHVYTIFVVIFGWVLFRAESISDASVVMKSMLGFAPNRMAENSYYLTFVDSPFNVLTFVLAIICSGPWLKKLLSDRITPGIVIIRDVLLLVLFLLSSFFILAGTYNPFIYFRF